MKMNSRIDGTNLVACLKARKVKAELADVIDEIQVNITTNIATYSVSVIDWGDQIYMHGCVCSLVNMELNDLLRFSIEDEEVCSWSDFMEPIDDCELLADEIINYIDEDLTKQLVKDLIKFDKTLEKLKEFYDETTVDIVKLLNEILSFCRD